MSDSDKERGFKDGQKDAANGEDHTGELGLANIISFGQLSDYNEGYEAAIKSSK
jgi:hypothetical protein